MTREALGFAVRMERRADIITAELEALKVELEQAAQTADNLRTRAIEIRNRVTVKELELV